MERYIGKMLDNRYEILEVIGTGGMAVVFKAKCHRLNRLVAVKVLKKDLSEDAEFRRRFHDESQAVAMLSHPNIVAVYDVSRGGDMDYIVMELIDGITLKEYVERRGCPNWPEALHFITQIMRGLSHAHSRGIIHRDIKPQNIMLLRDGTVKVMDFGIACLSSGPSNEAIGSVHYISPEQAKGDYTDNRSDIYSAGVVLYEMLTSRLPFEGSDPVSVAIQHFSAVPLTPRELNSEIPEALEQICMKAMAPDRNKRYSTADEMLADLEAFRKDPNLSFDYTVDDLQDPKRGEEEPTQYLPNVAVTRNKNSHRAERIFDEEEEPEVEERPKRIWLRTLIFIILLAGAGWFAVDHIYNAIMDSFPVTEVPEYTVPQVVGKTVEEAGEMEEVKDVFSIVERSREYSDLPEGQIISQDPEADRKKKPANGQLIEINVTVSRGARSGAMPNVVGMDARSARVKLEHGEGLDKLNLVIQEAPEQEFHDEIEAGSVIRTDPAVNTPLHEGDTITLVVSKGPEIIYHPMVACKGSTVEQVQKFMDDLNFVAEFTKVEGVEPEGTVLTQSVDTGVEVAEGSTVTFTYSDGEKLIEKTVSYTVPASEGDVYVEMYLDDTRFFAGTLPGTVGTIQEKVFQKAGTYELRVYLNDVVDYYDVLTFSANG